MASAVVGLQDATVVTLLNAVAAAGAGPTFAVPPGSRENDLTWDVVVAGGPPASLQVDLQGSLDAAFTNPIQLDTYNVVANTGRHVVNKAIPFIRANLIAIGAGGGTVTVRLHTRARGGR